MRAQRPHHRSMPSIRWPDAAPREWHYFASRRGEGEIKQLQTYHKPQPPSGTRVQHGGLPSCEDQWPPSYPQPPPSDIPMPLGAIRWESQSYAHWRELQSLALSHGHPKHSTTMVTFDLGSHLSISIAYNLFFVFIYLFIFCSVHLFLPTHCLDFLLLLKKRNVPEKRISGLPFPQETERWAKRIDP